MKKVKSNLEWKYKSPEIYFKFNNSIYMSSANGILFKDYLNKNNNKNIIKKTGEFLSNFHKETISNNKVIGYGDFSKMNLIIDEKNKIVWGIDPGGRFGKKCCPESDFVSMYMSIFIEEVKSKRFKFSNLYYYIKGYKDSSDYNLKINKVLISIIKFTKFLSRKIKRFKYIKISIIIIISFISFLFINLLYKINSIGFGD